MAECDSMLSIRHQNVMTVPLIQATETDNVLGPLAAYEQMGELSTFQNSYNHCVSSHILMVTQFHYQQKMPVFYKTAFTALDK